jgi:hypothetical protein
MSGRNSSSRRIVHKLDILSHMKKIMVPTLTCDNLRKKVDITLINKFQRKKEVEATRSKAR